MPTLFRGVRHVKSEEEDTSTFEVFRATIRHSSAPLQGTAVFSCFFFADGRRANVPTTTRTSTLHTQRHQQPHTPISWPRFLKPHAAPRSTRSSSTGFRRLPLYCKLTTNVSGATGCLFAKDLRHRRAAGARISPSPAHFAPCTPRFTFFDGFTRDARSRHTQTHSDRRETREVADVPASTSDLARNTCHTF